MQAEVCVGPEGHVAGEIPVQHNSKSVSGQSVLVKGMGCVRRAGSPVDISDLDSAPAALGQST